MKAYNKQEVDSTFSGWQSDLDQLDVIEVVPSSVLDKIRAEVGRLDNLNPNYLSSGIIMIDKHDVYKIIDKYKAESEEERRENEV